MAGLLKVPQRGRERVYCTYHCSIYTSLDMLTSHPQLSQSLEAPFSFPFHHPSAQLCTTLLYLTILWSKHIFFSCLMEEQLHLFFSVLGVVTH